MRTGFQCARHRQTPLLLHPMALAICTMRSRSPAAMSTGEGIAHEAENAGAALDLAR